MLRSVSEGVQLHRRHAIDRAVVALAGRQEGAVATWQLLALGLGRGAIAQRVARGWLTRRFRGTYVVGPLEGPWTRTSAALLACGSSAIASHESAAALWGIRALPVDVHVTVIHGHRAGHAGIQVHHAALDGDEIARRRFPATSPARTLLDLAATIPQAELERALNEAQVQRLTTPTQILSFNARRSHHRGTRALARALQSEPHLTKSEAEERLLALVRKVGLPEPRTNTRLGRYEVDAYWPQLGLVVEIDSWRFHATRGAFERDRRKTQDLEAAGYRVIRFTAWQLIHEPEVVAARLAVAISAREQGARAGR